MSLETQGSLGFHANSLRRPSSMNGPRYSAQTYGTDRVATGATTQPSSLNADVTLSRRCEFLEKQSKTIKETVNQSTTERQRFQSDVTATTRAMYEEMQWVYAKTTKAKLFGRTALDGSDEHTIATKKGSRVLLTYPMRERKVRVASGTAKTEYLMRCKTVDPDTAQLSIHWVVVQDVVTDASGATTTSRYVDSFAFAA